MDEEIRKQVEANFAAFQQRLPDLLPSHHGKFALMHDSEIVEFYDTARDAFLTGQRLFPDGLFSVQEVIDLPVDLGFYSHAVPGR
jgi:hypothetical protein